ncbi:hypothetical protein [Planococcus sp. 4-30]|uniref:hypothetical protein n=1 Tax=Planococcus TaxID=1372 RepID=UPI001CC06BB5|nr:hypothetical protein [Planococcus sp. 4-30]
MYKLLMLLYWLSAILTLAAFYGMNALSEPVKNDGFGGGNGNPTLVIPFFLMPFIMYFLYGTVELSMRIASKWLTSRSIWLGILISSVYVVTVSVYTLKKADDFRSYIVETKDAFDNPEDFSLFTIFSNHIFFNPLTFILVVMICFLAGLVWSLIRDRPKKK